MSRTSILLAAFVLSLLLLAAVAHFQPRASHGTPPADPTARCVAQPIRDLGHITARKEWKIAFPVRNDGTRRLVLNELDPDCNCPDRPVRTILIPPGQTGEVTVTLDTRFASGPIESTATFTTSDPANPSLTLTVRALVDAAALPQPTIAPPRAG